MTGGGSAATLVQRCAGCAPGNRFSANGHRASDMFAEHDDGGFGAGARRLGVRVVGDVEFAVLVFLQRAGTLLLGRSPCRFDGDKLRPRGNLAVDVGRHLGLEARRVKALVALHVRKQAGIESAATWAGDASSGFGFEGGVLAVERCLGKVQVEVGLNPRAQVLGRKQVRFLVLPVLAPAVLERLGLMLLRQTGNQVGMAGGDALLDECLGHIGDKLQQTTDAHRCGWRSCRIWRQARPRRSRAGLRGAESPAPLRRGERPHAASSRPTATPSPGHRQVPRCGREVKTVRQAARRGNALPCDDLETVGVRADGDGLNEAMLPDGLGKLFQLGLLEGLAGVGGGLMNLVDGDVLECAAVLHGALLGLS